MRHLAATRLAAHRTQLQLLDQDLSASLPEGPFDLVVSFFGAAVLFEFATGRRTRIVELGKPWWFGMALSPDSTSLLFSLVDSAGSKLMLVENFR